MPTGGVLKLGMKKKLTVARHTILANLDNVLNGYNLAKLEAARRALRDVNSRVKLGDLARDRGVLDDEGGTTVEPSFEAHLRNDWLNENGKGYWKKLDKGLPIWMRLRAAVIEIIDVIIASIHDGARLTSSTTWIGQGSEATTEFIPVINAGAKQVTTTILTPAAPRALRIQGMKPRRNKRISIILPGKTRPAVRHPLEFR